MANIKIAFSLHPQHCNIVAVRCEKRRYKTREIFYCFYRECSCTSARIIRRGRVVSSSLSLLNSHARTHCLYFVVFACFFPPVYPFFHFANENSDDVVKMNFRNSVHEFFMRAKYILRRDKSAREEKLYGYITELYSSKEIAPQKK